MILGTLLNYFNSVQFQERVPRICMLTLVLTFKTLPIPSWGEGGILAPPPCMRPSREGGQPTGGCQRNKGQGLFDEWSVLLVCCSVCVQLSSGTRRAQQHNWRPNAGLACGLVMTRMAID